MDWTDYQPFDVRIDRPLREVDRAVAQDHFDRLMAARPARAAALTALWRRHDPAAPTVDDPAAPAGLGAWLQPALATAGPRALDDGPDVVAWTGAVADVALAIGDQIVARAASGAVRWALCVSHKKATGYQRPVLMGFARVDDPHYYVDVAHMVATWADLAARRRAARPDFLATIVDVTLRDA